MAAAGRLGASGPWEGDCSRPGRRGRGARRPHSLPVGRAVLNDRASRGNPLTPPFRGLRPRGARARGRPGGGAMPGRGAPGGGRPGELASCRRGLGEEAAWSLAGGAGAAPKSGADPGAAAPARGGRRDDLEGAAGWPVGGRPWGGGRRVTRRVTQSERYISRYVMEGQGWPSLGAHNLTSWPTFRGGL